MKQLTLFPDINTGTVSKRHRTIHTRARRYPKVDRLRLLGQDGLSELYHDQKLSAGDIAKRFGIAPSTARNVLIEYGVRLRSSLESMQIKRSLGRINYPTGENSPYWRGGRQETKSGYVLVRVFPDDPFYAMANNRGFVPEHRLVMAKKLGRCLLPWEQVHHIDGVKNNNNECNLELISPVNHSLYKKMCTHCPLRKQVGLLGRQNQELIRQLQGKLTDGVSRL